MKSSTSTMQSESRAISLSLAALRDLVRRVAMPTLQDIVGAGLCVGCGACEIVAGSDVVPLQWDEYGSYRPHVLRHLDSATQSRIRSVCPGLRVQLHREASHGNRAKSDVVFGEYYSLVEAHAADSDVRFKGSSGGVLTALAIHLLETSAASAILHVGQSASHPLRTEARISRTSGEVLLGSGSRYGPAAPLKGLGQLLDGGERFAVVGRPCDIAAVRNLARIDKRIDQQVVAQLSFMCGGQAEMSFFRRLIDKHDVREEQVTGFRCRGNGCPGLTVVDTDDGRRLEFTYAEVWGDDIHNWGQPFRCKICPDSQAEQADLLCFDSEPPEQMGQETEGFNSVITRTRRGEQLLQEAEQSHQLIVTRDLRVDGLYEWESHIVRRHAAALARLAGTAVRSGIVPRVRGYRLLSAARRAGFRSFERNARGAWKRAGEARESLPVELKL